MNTDLIAVLHSRLTAGSDTPAGIRLTGGGQAANTAAWLAWQGHRVTLIAAVGDDEPGQARLAELTGIGVRCAVRRCSRAPTGTVIVLVEGGDRTMITQRGANLSLTAEDVDAALLAAPDHRHLHLSAYPLLDEASRGAGLRALALARERRMSVSVDAASAQPLRRAGPDAFLGWVRGIDLLLANADEAAVLTGGEDAEPAARALTATARNVIVKLGPAGALWAGPDGSLVRSPAPRALVADPTGAGDAFAAGVLAAWVAGVSPREALGRAVRLGATAAAAVGARPPVTHNG